MQPVAVTGEATAPRVTHLTGSFTPDPPLEGHGIISATNEFMGAQGTVRLSGGANLFSNGSLGFMIRMFKYYGGREGSKYETNDEYRKRNTWFTV